MAQKIRVAGREWDVESIREDGSKVIAKLVGGAEIATRGATANALRSAFKVSLLKKK